MKLDRPAVVTPQQRALAEAAERAWPTGADDPVLAECEEHEEREKQPLRVMMWHIPDLGGGLCRSPESDARVIESYAALIDGLAIDVCIVLGVRDSLGEQPQVVGSGAGAYLVMRPTPPDRGPAELQRVAKALGGAWSLAIPRRASDGKNLYVAGSTIGVLYRGLPSPTFDVVDVAPRPTLGIGGKACCVRFDSAAHCDKPLAFVASPAVPVPSDEPDLVATAELPPACVFAVSADRGLQGAGELAALRSALAARGKRLAATTPSGNHACGAEGVLSRTLASARGQA